jgi:hypothetical protein
MATTDSKPGFRLPWSTDHRAATDEQTATQAAEQADETPVSAGKPAVPPDETAIERDATDRATQPHDHELEEPEAPVMPIATSQDHAVEREPTATTTPVERAGASPRPAKFLADLTRAMQVAAQAERVETLSQYQAEAKAFIEQIQSGSSGRAGDLRKRADEDIAAIREWSKAEMARIREDTDSRISGRKTDLDGQLKRHEAHIEHEVELVQGRIDAYQDEMAAFFEQLLAIDDPTAFAAMAANLPEPPPFEIDLQAMPATAVRPVEPLAAPAPEPERAVAHDESEPLVVDAPVTAGASSAEEAPSAEGASSDASELPVADEGSDPRITALGLTPDFAAAEAEAAVDAAGLSGDGSEDGEGIPIVGDEALAVRLAGLVPPADPSAAPTNAGAIATTQVAVVGLVSVASIAGFKRHLARVPGVQSVGVSSGPDGEFLFSVVHHDDVSLRDIVPTLPGFQARVSSAGDGVVNVTAHDPESAA